MEKWHKLGSCMVCEETETGRVMKAMKPDVNGSMVPAMPYRHSATLRCWQNAQGVKLSTLRSGISRGAYAIM